jgi:hypothetical protein
MSGRALNMRFRLGPSREIAIEKHLNYGMEFLEKASLYRRPTVGKRPLEEFRPTCGCGGAAEP